MVQNFIHKIIGYKTVLDPYLYLLTIINIEISSTLRYVITHIVITARLLNVQMWKTLQIPYEEALKNI